MRNILYFDLETQKSADEVGGWNNIRDMRMSVGVTYSTARNESGAMWAVDYLRVEGRTVPQLQRIRRLHVAVAVNEHGRRVRRVIPEAEHRRMARRVPRFDVDRTRAAQPVRDPVGGTPHVGGVVRIRADRGNGDERRQFLPIAIGVRVKVAERSVHRLLAPVHRQRLAGDPARVVACEEQDAVRDVVGRAQALQCNTVDQLLLAVIAV